MKSLKPDEAAARLEALGNPTRLQVYRILAHAGKAGMPVGILRARLGIAGSTLSHHLKTLVIAGLVAQERQATTLVCRVDAASMRGLVFYLVAECTPEAERRTPSRRKKPSARNETT
jgi:ArsR family transcriptional regulator, arsenate/arsenite/antimonite-responsive transcriptional repressor